VRLAFRFEVGRRAVFGAKDRIQSFVALFGAGLQDVCTRIGEGWLQGQQVRREKRGADQPSGAAGRSGSQSDLVDQKVEFRRCEAFLGIEEELEEVGRQRRLEELRSGTSRRSRAVLKC